MPSFTHCCWPKRNPFFPLRELSVRSAVSREIGVKSQAECDLRSARAKSKMSTTCGRSSCA